MSRAFKVQESVYLKEKDVLERASIPSNPYLHYLNAANDIGANEILHMVIIYKKVYQPVGQVSLLTDVFSLMQNGPVADVRNINLPIYCVFNKQEDSIKFADWLHRTNSNVLPSIFDGGSSTFTPVYYEITDISSMHDFGMPGGTRFELTENNLNDISWLETHCKYPWYWNNHFLFFESEDDAMNFKLQCQNEKVNI